MPEREKIPTETLQEEVKSVFWEKSESKDQVKSISQILLAFAVHQLSNAEKELTLSKVKSF